MAFQIIQIPNDPGSIKAHVEDYKIFRLLALQTNPEAFGSTYAREITFTDETWYNRLANPMAFTFIAVEDGKTLSTLTILGPLPFGPDDIPPPGNPWEVAGNPNQPFSHWRINGMFTLPEARGKGISKTMIYKALEYATAQAAVSGKEFLGTIAVEKDNVAAKSLYEKCGFVTFKDEPYEIHGQQRAVLLMKTQ